MEKELCCGCSACSNVCPESAIVMAYDDEGNMYPQIEETKCIHCGLCESVCAFRADIKTFSEEINVQKVYAAKATDQKILMQSSSGGIAFLITEYALSAGYDVYACVQTQDGNVIHKKISQAKEASGSKYVQSFLGACYSEIRTALENERKVLFIGVACQVAALKRYLKCSLSPEQMEALLTIDILCHGVPSRGVFFKYCEWLEKKNKSKIERIVFRDKKAGYQSCINGNRVYLVDKKQDSLSLFYSLYFDHLILRPSCTVCPYKNLHRDADITLSDFWNIKQYLPDFESTRGVSRVLLNTEKAEQVFSCIKNNCVIEESTLDSCHSVTQFNRPAIIDRKQCDTFYKTYMKSPYGAFEKYRRRAFMRKVKAKFRSILKR